MILGCGLIWSQGDSVSHALECILQSAHLNLTKNVTSAIGSQMGMQASTFGRLGLCVSVGIMCVWSVIAHLTTGVSCQSWLYGELFQQCYADQSPAEDILHSGCRNAFLVGLECKPIQEHMKLTRIDSLPKKGVMRKHWLE